MRSILRHDSSYCYGCPLSKDESHYTTYIPTDVYYSDVRGKEETPVVDVLVVGEPPTSSEDRIGFPFAGASGSDLKKALGRAGIEDYAVMNCVRCRCLDSEGKRRNPSVEEIAACKNYLLKDIEVLQPRVLLLAGTLPVHMIGENPAWRKKTAHSLKGHVYLERDKPSKLVTINPNYYIKSEDAGERRKFFRNVGAVENLLTGKETKWSREGEVKLLTTLKEVDEVVDYFQYECDKPIAFDTETKNLNMVASNKLGTVQLSSDMDLAYVIPVDHWDTPFKDKKDRIHIKKRLNRLFSDGDTKFPFWVMHNYPFDIHKVLRHLKVKKQPAKLVIDTQFLAYIQDENQAGGDDDADSPGGYNAFRLKDLVRDLLHFYLYDTKFSDAMAARSGASGGSLWDLSLDALSAYGGTDAYVTLRLFYFYRKWLSQQGYDTALKFAHRWYGRTAYPLMKMTENGFPLDKDQLSYLRSSGSPIISRLKEIPRSIYSTKEAKRANQILLREDSRTKGMKPLFGKQPWVLDITKKKHRVHLFVDSCGLTPLGKGKDGTPSINKAYFDAYKSHPIISLYKEYSGLDKLNNSYLNSVGNLLVSKPDNAIDGNIRASFHLIRTATGRASSSVPNLQQLPKGKPHTAKAHIRSLYGVRPGRMILEADYGQAEVRWWAQISGDKDYANLFHEMKRLRDLYRSTGDLDLKAKVDAEADIHKKVAGIMFKKSVYDVTSDERKRAKSLCFACIFGQHFKTLAANLQIRPEEALDLQTTFVQEFRRAGEWLLDIEESASRSGIVTTPMGRIRHLADIYAKNEGAGNRRARNSPIQAASSDTTVLAAWRMQHTIEEEGLPFKLINCVHDAITLDIPLDYESLSRGVRLMDDCMVNVDDFLKEEFGIDMIVPMEIDFDIGVRWGHLLNFDGVESNLHKIFDRCVGWDKRLSSGEKWHSIANEEWPVPQAA